MIYSVEISEQAEKDLKEIFEYIAFTLFSPQNAAKQLKRLEKSISGLDCMPQRFRKYEKEPWCSRNLRQMPVDNFKVFYIADDKMKKVFIIRILYDKRNDEKQLNCIDEAGFLMEETRLK